MRNGLFSSPAPTNGKHRCQKSGKGNAEPIAQKLQRHNAGILAFAVQNVLDSGRRNTRFEAIGAAVSKNFTHSGGFCEKTLDIKEEIRYNIYVRYIGASPSGKAPDFDSGIRWFESSRPSQKKALV